MIKKLEWDSDFFGYNVGQVIINADELINENALVTAAKKFKVVYVVSDTVVNFKSEKLKLVDIKTTLIKTALIQEDCFHNSLNEYADEENGKLQNLALQSGAYSRFKTDINFVNNEFEKLYIKWVNDSIDKINADLIIVFKDADGCKGFITLKYESDFSEIGLLAVDEQSRGKGIGLSLLCYANNITKNRGLKKMLVTTQFENQAAVRLYEKAGYKIFSKKYIYHLWN